MHPKSKKGKSVPIPLISKQTHFSRLFIKSEALVNEDVTFWRSLLREERLPRTPTDWTTVLISVNQCLKKLCANSRFPLPALGLIAIYWNLSAGRLAERNTLYEPNPRLKNSACQACFNQLSTRDQRPATILCLTSNFPCCIIPIKLIVNSK